MITHTANPTLLLQILGAAIVVGVGVGTLLAAIDRLTKRAFPPRPRKHSKQVSTPKVPALRSTRTFVYHVAIHPSVKGYKWFGDIVPALQVPVKGRVNPDDYQCVVLCVPEMYDSLFLQALWALRKADNATWILDVDLQEIK